VSANDIYYNTHLWVFMQYLLRLNYCQNLKIYLIFFVFLCFSFIFEVFYKTNQLYILSVYAVGFLLLLLFPLISILFHLVYLVYYYEHTMALYSFFSNHQQYLRHLIQKPYLPVHLPLRLHLCIICRLSLQFRFY